MWPRRQTGHRPGRLLALLALTLLPLSCSTGASTDSAKSITLYTCVSDETIQPVISQFESKHPGTDVKLYRATTGDLNARIAADIRSGGLQADLIWACDPLTMQGYVDQGLVGGWLPAGSADIPPQFRTDDYVGAAVLYMVAAYHAGVPAPNSWSDLTRPQYAPVAVSDPNVAASALGALGYFSQAPNYGLDFYSSLAASGGKQVSTPDDVVTGVAQGLFRSGITIANSAYVAKDAGSPIEVTWPKPGAIAIYGPIALAKASMNSTIAKDFISYVVSKPGQQVVAKGGSYPTLPGIAGPQLPAHAPIVYPDWPKITANKSALLNDYQQIFGG